MYLTFITFVNFFFWKIVITVDDFFHLKIKNPNSAINRFFSEVRICTSKIKLNVFCNRNWVFNLKILVIIFHFSQYNNNLKHTF